MESWLQKICVGCRDSDHEKYSAQDEVVEIAFALSYHEAIKIAETPAIALAALARQGRGED